MTQYSLLALINLHWSLLLCTWLYLLENVLLLR